MLLWSKSQWVAFHAAGITRMFAEEMGSFGENIAIYLGGGCLLPAWY